MSYTKQQILDHYNSVRGQNFTLAELGQYLAKQALRAELAQMLRDDAQLSEQTQIEAI